MLLIPDLVGMKLDRALEILNSLDIKDAEVIVTAPPREDKVVSKDMRIIKLSSSESGKIELLVCK